MDVSLVIRLIDQLSGPAQKARTALAGLKQAADDLRTGFTGAIQQGFSVENVEAAARNAQAKLQQARDRLRGALALGVALVVPIKAIGDFETRLTGFGNVAGIFGDDLKAIETQLREIGPTVNKSASEMLEALEYLVGKGMSPDQALASLRAIGMTSTATGAQIGDMAASGYAALDNLKVPVQDLQRAFDAMAQAGKAGGFELNSMAQYFPALTAQAALLKMEGVAAVAELAAALQVARKATGDDATAANNMQNFLMKLSSPETRRNFAKIGVDIEKEFQVASDKGISVLEHMLTLIHEKTGGDSARIADLFGDAQVINFLAPLMQNMEEFRRIRDAALSARGVNEGDFQRVMATFDATLKSIVVQLGNLVAAGSPVLEIAKEVAQQLLNVLKAANAFASANPELTRQIVYAVAGLLAMNIAARLLSVALAAARVGAIGIASAFLKFNADGKNIAVGWRLIAGAGRMLAGALGLVKAAAVGVGGLLAGITAPAWAAIAALMAAGLALWKYWDRVSSFVAGFAAPFRDLLGPLIDGAIAMFDRLITKIAELLGIDASGFKAAIGAMFDFSGLIEGARQTLSDFWSWLGSLFSQEQLSGAEKGALYEAGRAMGQSLIDGIKELLLSALGGIQDLFKFAVEIDWPDPPAWLQWLVDKATGAADVVADQVGGWVDGGNNRPSPGAPGSASGMAKKMLEGMDRVADQLQLGGERAATEITNGASEAGGRLGERASSRIKAGAAAAGAEFGRAAAAVISKTAVRIQMGNHAQSDRAVAQGIRDAKAGALHGGTE